MTSLSPNFPSPSANRRNLQPEWERQRERAQWSVRMESVQVRLGKAIRRRRRALDMTLENLGAACGVSFQQIQKYETGQQAISAAQLWTIATALEVTVADLFDFQLLR